MSYIIQLKIENMNKTYYIKHFIIMIIIFFLSEALNTVSLLAGQGERE